MSPHVGTRLRLDASLSGLAVSRNEILRCDDAATDARVDRDACHRVGTVSMICVPLRRGPEPVGVLKVSAARPRVFSERDVAVLYALADFITVTISAASDVARIANELVADQQTAGQGYGERAADGQVDVISSFVADVLQPGTVETLTARREVRRLLDEEAFTVVGQAIVDLDTLAVVGVEALTRFDAEPPRTPDQWFAEAARVGLGRQLEVAAVRAALRQLSVLPSDLFLAINISADAVCGPELDELLAAVPRARIVLELTEHLAVHDYPRLRNHLSRLRLGGTRLAIDDSGAGYSGLAHIYQLGPEIIKLDRQLILGIEHDPARRALASALATFATETNALLIAEGVETKAALSTIRRLGVHYAQGYLLGRPSESTWRNPRSLLIRSD